MGTKMSMALSCQKEFFGKLREAYEKNTFLEKPDRAYRLGDDNNPIYFLFYEDIPAFGGIADVVNDIKKLSNEFTGKILYDEKMAYQHLSLYDEYDMGIKYDSNDTEWIIDFPVNVLLATSISPDAEELNW